VKDPNTKSGERRTAATLMATAINKAWAHQQLLEAHTAQLRQQQDSLSKPQNAGEMYDFDAHLGGHCHSLVVAPSQLKLQQERHLNEGMLDTAYM